MTSRSIAIHCTVRRVGVLINSWLGRHCIQGNPLVLVTLFLVKGGPFWGNPLHSAGCHNPSCITIHSVLFRIVQQALILCVFYVWVQHALTLGLSEFCCELTPGSGTAIILTLVNLALAFGTGSLLYRQ